MILSDWGMTLQQSFNNLLGATVNFLPNLVLAIVIFVIGWFLGVLIGRVIAQAIKAIKADTNSLKLQNEFYKKAQHPLDTPQ